MLGAKTFLGLRSDEWKDLADAMASVATLLAILVGGWWAWRRFRRTPESRAKIDLGVNVGWETRGAGSGDFVRVDVSATNKGGRSQRLLSFGVNGQPSTAACWSLRTDDIAKGVGSMGFIDWSQTDGVSAELLAGEINLEPHDEWTETVLFPLPSNTEAVRVLAQFFVGSSMSDAITLEKAVILARDPEKARHNHDQ